MNFIKKMLKNMILSTITIYSINLITVHLNFIIPLNYCSLLITSLLGLPGLMSYTLLALKYM